MGFRANVVARRAPHPGGDRGHRRRAWAPRMKRRLTSPDEGRRRPENLAGKGRDELWSPEGPRTHPIPSTQHSWTTVSPNTWRDIHYVGVLVSADQGLA